MLRRHFVQLKQPLLRAYATVQSPHALVFIEHRAGVLNSGSLSAVTAASTLGGQVTGVIVGALGEVDEVVQKARKLHGLNKVLYSTSPQFSPPLPEAVAPLLRKLVQEGTPYTHVVAAHSSSGKSILPRAAAIVDTPQVSDVISLDHNVSENSTTFTRPIYAGNVIETVVAPSSIPFKFFTVRETAFDPAKEGDSEVEVEAVDPVEVPITTEHVETSISKSDRPDLGVASKVVSGGRALKDAETFKRVLDPLANVLGAAVGASRAAVDAGYADNSLQVGQTGKIVAPELYIAIGISGAIQHLAGMKDSKLIVAINKDPDAPIFEIADVGLVADLFEAVPELTEKLQK